MTAAPRPLDDLVRPPQWAESLLRLLLPPKDVEAISGDLLEEYRENARPRLGRRRADLWFIGQLVRYISPTVWIWSVLFPVALLTRTAFDWFAPPLHFNYQARSVATTYTAISLIVLVGFSAAWRSRSVRAGALAGILTLAMSSIVNLAATSLMVAIWHDPDTLLNIQMSGGLDEDFVLAPVIWVVGTLLATCGALAATGIRTLLSRA